MNDKRDKQEKTLDMPEYLKRVIRGVLAPYVMCSMLSLSSSAKRVVRRVEPDMSEPRPMTEDDIWEEICESLCIGSDCHVDLGVDPYNEEIEGYELEVYVTGESADEIDMGDFKYLACENIHLKTVILESTNRVRMIGVYRGQLKQVEEQAVTP